MNHEQLTSYLRSHRKRSGLSQKEVGLLLGNPDHGQLSRHERLFTMPSLLTALSYQAIFGIPISELFPGIYEAAKQGVEERLDKMKQEWQDSSAKGRKGAQVARKLEWSWERENPDLSDPIYA
jgi:transcriptional regulator with XRE-family HTH domain